MIRGNARRDRLAFLAVALGVGMMCGVGALLLFALSTPPRLPGPPLYPEMPLYPGASAVSVVTRSKLPQHPSIALERMTTFTADARPEAILAFYEETLTKAGWSLFEKISPIELGFYWTDGTAISGLYKVNVITKLALEGGTQVILEAGEGIDDVR